MPVETRGRYVKDEKFEEFMDRDLQELKQGVKALRSDVREMRIDLKEIRIELIELRGEVKVLTQRVDGIITTLNWDKYIFVLVVLLPFIERLVSRFI
jgi:hypothetical protein